MFWGRKSRFPQTKGTRKSQLQDKLSLLFVHDRLLDMTNFTSVVLLDDCSLFFCQEPFDQERNQISLINKKFSSRRSFYCPGNLHTKKTNKRKLNTRRVDFSPLEHPIENVLQTNQVIVFTRLYNLYVPQDLHSISIKISMLIYKSQKAKRQKTRQKIKYKKGKQDTFLK